MKSVIHHSKNNYDTTAQDVTFEYIRSRATFWNIKRAGDIFFAGLVVLFVLSWALPLIAFLTLLDSGGPVFFKQRRVGRYGKAFICLKFRTMYKNIEADFQQASQGDPRITKVGRFLRLTNIDELPQFLNVLMGDMSIVGPRPHMYKDCRDFSKIVKNYKLRSLVKPGITGMAQIKGFRGPTETDLSIYQRFKWDLFYVRKASFLLDLLIILITAKQTVSHFFKVATNFLSSKRNTSAEVLEENNEQAAA